MNSSYDSATVKEAARGRWVEILIALAGLPEDLLRNPRRHGPCPKCGGTDRFRAFDDVAETGGTICNQCGRNNGDGFATIQWARDQTFPEALNAVAEFLGISRAPPNGHPLSIVEAVARLKHMPLDAFREFGAVEARRNGQAVARVPVHDERGAVVSHFDLGLKGWLQKGLSAKGLDAGLFLPGRPEPGETWLLVEGVKDAAALVGLGYRAAGLPTCEMNVKFAALFRGVHVILIPDLDRAGQAGANRSASRLLGVAQSVRVARLPGEIVAKDGADVRDVLLRPDGESLVRNAIENARHWHPSEAGVARGDMPEIELVHDEGLVVGQVLPVVGGLGWTLRPDEVQLRTFQRAGALVHVIVDGSPTSGIDVPDGARRIRPLPQSLLRERIATGARLYSTVERHGELVRTSQRPPKWLVEAIDERGEYPRDVVRPIEGILTAPTLRADGTILQRPGYDDETGLLLELTGTWPVVPDQPDRAMATVAAKDLLDVVSDFPFVGDAHRSGWLALVLTMIGRPAIAGPCPLFLVDANTRGSGKSLLADAAGVIAGGLRLPRKTWTNSDNETRKVITAVALEALPVVLLDNINGGLGCAALDAALTGCTWTDRLLGLSKTTGVLPLTAVWCATGNNVQLEADTARRTLLMRLESPLENPEERTGFAHPDLISWVRAERRRLAVAAMTILRAYVAAGRPRQAIDPWGSYEAWSDLIRSSIVWAGMADPAATRAITRDADRSAELLRLVLTGLHEVGGEGTSHDLIRALDSNPSGPGGADRYPSLRLAVAELCGDKSTTARLGAKLRSFVGRVHGGRRLAKSTAHGGVTMWRSEATTEDPGGHG